VPVSSAWENGVVSLSYTNVNSAFTVANKAVFDVKFDVSEDTGGDMFL